MVNLSDAVMTEAVSKGLCVERVPFSDRRRWDERKLLIEEKPCQIVRGCYSLPDWRSPNRVSTRLYLPRTDWPDFVIYVVTKRTSTELEYYIVPRGLLSKDTYVCPARLSQYRDAWKILKEPFSAVLFKRRFAGVSWRLRKATAAAKLAGLSVSLIPYDHPRRRSAFLQTRVIIAGRRCTLHSLKRISKNRNKTEHRYVALHRQQGEWGEFELHALSQSEEPTVYVIPSTAIQADATISLDSEGLKTYKNNWAALLT